MKNLFIVLLFLFSIDLLHAQSCSNMHTVISSDGLNMYFVSDRDGGDFEIYKSDINGNNPVRLTNSVDKKSFPAISPDGTKLLFQSEDYSSASEIYLMNTDGSNLVQLTNNSIYDGYPNFSPDGLRIVFSAWDNTIYPEIFVMNLDGTNRTQITNLQGTDWNFSPKYNPSGTQIYYLESSNGNNHIVMMDLDGSNKVNITSANTYGTVDLYPSFNADGSKMVFSTSENTSSGGKLEIYIADVDGQNWQKITSCMNNDNYDFPIFNPLNSSELYFSYNTYGGKTLIKKMFVDGTNLLELAMCSSIGVFSVDGKKNIEVSPNPVIDCLHIDLGDNLNINSRRMKIMNTLGQTVFVSNLTNNNSVFSLHGILNPGIYFVHVMGDKLENIGIRKIVIQ